MNTEADQATVESRIETALFGADEPAVKQDAPEDQDTPEVLEDEEVEPIEAQDSAEASDDDDAESPEETDDHQYQTIDELAEALELTPEAFADQTKVKVEVYGKEREVSIAELRAGFQKGEAFDEKKGQLSQERAEFESNKLQYQQAIQSDLAVARSLAEMAEKQITDEYQAINWQALADEDPGRAAYLKQHYTERFNQVSQAKNQAAMQAQQAQIKVMQERLPQEKAAMLKAIPEWNDKEVATKEQAEITQMLQGAGFSNEEINGIADHRAVALLRDLYQLRKGQQKMREGKQEKRVVSKKTTVLKAGPRKSQTEKQRSRADALRSRLKKTGNKNDLAAVLLERMR